MRSLRISKKVRYFSIFVLFAALAFKTIDDRFEVSKNIEIFTAVYKEINLQYVDETKPGELMRKGIDAMLSSLDPYTNFYSEAQAEEAFTQRTGEYGGLGINVAEIGDYLTITDVFEGYAGQKADLRIGDQLISVNGRDMKKKTLNDLSPVMKGAAGTEVTIIVNRPKIGELSKTVIREEIKLKNVPFYGKVNDETGYIYLANFMQDASKEVEAALIDLKKQGCKSFILDLRNNPGGFLMESVNIVNLFVPRGELVVYTKGRTDADIVEYKTMQQPFDKEAPLVVLINNRSASASEIVSGTLQDLDRAVVLGSNSYGKGLVQNTRPLPYRTQMKLTIAKYYTPSGRCIQALDYSHRNEDGSVGKTPDSLRQAFKTRKGRTVYDSGGIRPDKEMDAQNGGDFIKSLEDNNFFMDFAVQYVNSLKGDSLNALFQASETDYQQFKSFVESKIDKLNTSADKQIKSLSETLKENQEIEVVQNELNALKNRIAEQKITKLNNLKPIVMQKLSLEIIRVYGLASMHSKAQFSKDPVTIDAINLLKNATNYNQLLK